VVVDVDEASSERERIPIRLYHQVRVWKDQGKALTFQDSILVQTRVPDPFCLLGTSPRQERADTLPPVPLLFTAEKPKEQGGGC
jgi:hypothetical protein